MPANVYTKNPKPTPQKPTAEGTWAQISKIFSHCTPSFGISSELRKSLRRASEKRVLMLLHHQLSQGRQECQPEKSYVNEHVSGWRAVERRSELLIKKWIQHLKILERFNYHLLKFIGETSRVSRNCRAHSTAQRFPVGEGRDRRSGQRVRPCTHAGKMTTVTPRLYSTGAATTCRLCLICLFLRREQTLPTRRAVPHRKHQPTEQAATGPDPSAHVAWKPSPPIQVKKGCDVYCCCNPQWNTKGRSPSSLNAVNV